VQPFIPLQDGCFSDSNIWNYCAVPGINDIIDLQDKYVIADADIACAALYNSQGGLLLVDEDRRLWINELHAYKAPVLYTYGFNIKVLLNANITHTDAKYAIISFGFHTISIEGNLNDARMWAIWGPTIFLWCESANHPKQVTVSCADVALLNDKLEDTMIARVAALVNNEIVIDNFSEPDSRFPPYYIDPDEPVPFFDKDTHDYAMARKYLKNPEINLGPLKMYRLVLYTLAKKKDATSCSTAKGKERLESLRRLRNSQKLSAFQPDEASNTVEHRNHRTSSQVSQNSTSK